MPYWNIDKQKCIIITGQEKWKTSIEEFVSETSKQQK